MTAFQELTQQAIHYLEKAWKLQYKAYLSHKRELLYLVEARISYHLPPFKKDVQEKLTSARKLGEEGGKISQEGVSYLPLADKYLDMAKEILEKNRRNKTPDAEYDDEEYDDGYEEEEEEEEKFERIVFSEEEEDLPPRLLDCIKKGRNFHDDVKVPMSQIQLYISALRILHPLKVDSKIPKILGIGEPRLKIPEILRLERQLTRKAYQKNKDIANYLNHSLECLKDAKAIIKKIGEGEKK